MANEQENRYICVAYKLYVPMKDNGSELVEEATAEHPFQLVSGMGLALDAFEAQVVPLKAGEAFDFTLSIDEAYGPYVEEAVQKVPRNVFEIDGRLDRNRSPRICIWEAMSMAWKRRWLRSLSCLNWRTPSASRSFSHYTPT